MGKLVGGTALELLLREERLVSLRELTNSKA